MNSNRFTFSIITPSFNQGEFIEDTIQSILMQEGDFYIDYIIMDGRSTDSSVDIIKKYEQLLRENCLQKNIDGNTYYVSENRDFMWNKCKGIRYRWVSKKDRGPVNAINKGFKKSIGDFVVWLNSDDYYLHKNVLSFVRDAHLKQPNVLLITGDCSIVDRNGKELWKHAVGRINLKELIYLDYHVSQPATFIHASLIDKFTLNENLKCTFDAEYFISMFVNGVQYEKLHHELVAFRMYGENITDNKALKMKAFRERLFIIRKYSDNIFYSVLGSVYQFCTYVLQNANMGSFFKKGYTYFMKWYKAFCYKKIIGEQYDERYRIKDIMNNHHMKTEEIKQKKILLVYHSNICNKTCGINSYFYHMFKILSEQGFVIDIFAPQSFDDNWENTEFITNVFLPSANDSFVDTIGDSIVEERGVLNWIHKSEIERFKKIESDYTYIIYSYVYYAELSKYVGDKTKNILSMTDFCSLQQMQTGGQKFENIIAEEIKAIKLFDTIIGISLDEISFFSNFTDNTQYFYLPHFIPVPHIRNIEKNIDILFLGSDNPHNVRGIQWFLENVYPFIHDKNYKIVIAGKVSQKIDKNQYPKIQYIDHVDDLETLFSSTRLLICPMFSGTGLKIKIVEAMSYGIPVVCTFKSMIGFPEKYENGCIISDTPDRFADSINQILSDDHLRGTLAQQARHQYDKYFNESSAKITLRKIFGDGNSLYTKPQEVNNFVTRQKNNKKNFFVTRGIMIRYLNVYLAKIVFALFSPRKFVRKYLNILKAKIK